jgi:hypothetical protein
MADTDPRLALAGLIAAARDGRLDVICEKFGVRVMSALGALRASREWIRTTLISEWVFGANHMYETASVIALRCGRPSSNWPAMRGIDLVVLDVDNPVLRAEALTGVPLYEWRRGE